MLEILRFIYILNNKCILRKVRESICVAIKNALKEHFFLIVVQIYFPTVKLN